MKHKRFSAFFALFAAMASALVGTGAVTALADDVTVADTVLRGGVEVVKYDVETGKSVPQGGADLAGVKFTITNKSDHAVVYYDEYGHKHEYATDESWDIETKWDATKKAYVAKTPANGLPYGSYHIQETGGSAGYGLATKETLLTHKYVPAFYQRDDMLTNTMYKWVDEGYDFSITKDGEVVTFDGKTGAKPGSYNPLIRGGIEVAKRDHDILRATAQGNADLEGATWIIRNENTYPVIVWDHFDQDANGMDHGVIAKAQSYTASRGPNAGTKWTTAIDSEGYVEPGGIVAIIHSGDDGRGQTFMDALPVGWYSIEEVEPPHGYTLDKRWVSYIEISNDDWDTIVATDCDDPVLRGAVQIQKNDFDFVTLETGITTPQGDCSFEGTEITIYNDSTRDVYIRDAATYNTGDISGTSGRVAPGGVVGVIKTNAQGIATLKGLPYGSYRAVETKAPYGYELNVDWEFTFDIMDESKMDSNGNKIVATNKDNLLLEDTLKPGPIYIYKVDAETGAVTSQVDNDFFDAESGIIYKVTNNSDNPVMWDSDGDGVKELYKKGEVLVGPGAKYGYSGSPVDLVEKNGYWGLELDNFPAGTYTVEEARAPFGYIRDTQSQDIVVSSDSDQSEFPCSFTDQVVREDLQFSKLDSNTNAPMAGIPFLLEKLDDDGNTIEWHILVTDEDGMVDTSSDQSGYQGWRSRFDENGNEHINLADQYYDPATGEFTYVAPFAEKDAVLAELNGDGTEENPGLIAELDALVDELDELLNTANVEGIQSLYEELTQIIRDLNTIAAELGDDSDEYAAKVQEEADKIVEIHEAIAAAKAAAGDDYLDQISALEDAIAAKEAEIADAQAHLAALDDEISGTKAIWETGYWFFGGERADGQKVSNEMGALPYGNYRLTELRCAANQGKKLMSRDLVIKRGHGIVENIGTIDNDTYTTCDPCNDRSVQGLEVDVQKTSTPAPNSVVKPGSDITYTLTYTNTSSETIPFTQIRDYIPASTTFKSVANDGVFVEGDGYVEWVIADLAPEQSGSVSFTVTVNRQADPIIVNQAHFGTSVSEIVAGSGLDDPYGSTNIIRHSTDGTKTGAYLAAVKTATPSNGAEVKVGDTIEYSITVTNMGDTDAASVGVADIVPEYTELAVRSDETTDYYDVSEIGDGYMVSDRLIGWNLGSLAAGASKTVSFKVVVTDAVRQYVRNQATFGFTKGKVTGPLDNSTNIVEHHVETLPEVTITKSCDIADTTAPGEILTYTLHIENNGRGNAVNVPVYDIIPEGTQYVMGSASSDVLFDEQHVYPSADGSATDASDDTPYVSWVIPVLYNRGGSADVSYQVRVKDSVKVGDVIQNRATVGGNGPAAVDVTEPTSTNLVDGAFAVSNLIEHTVIDPLDDVEITKTAEPADGSYIAAGDEITYTIEWKNNGTHPVSGFGVRDAIPENTEFVWGSIVVTGADGKTSDEVKAEAQQQTQDNPDECGTIEVTDSVVWTPVVAFGDANASDPENIFRAITGGDVNEETHHVYNWKSLKVAIANLAVGESVEFEVKVDDDYDQLWRATLLEDGRLALLMRILVPNQDDSPNFVRANGIIGNYDQKWNDVYALQNELKPGETGKLTFKVKVNEDVADDTEIKNHATYGKGVYAPPCFDLERETNTTTHIVGSPELVAEKTVSPTGTAKLGDTLHYTVTVTNNGTARARNIAIRDQFREDGALKGVAYVPGSFQVSGGDAAEQSAEYAATYGNGTDIICARATTLGPGESIVMQFDVNIVDAFMGDVIKNKATWASEFEGDPFEADLENETNETEVVVDEAQLSITKTVDPKSGTQVAVGDTLTYTFVVTNTSSVTASDVAVYDAIPNYTTFVAGSATGGLKALTDADGNVTALAADGITLAGGASKEFSFKVTVDPSLVEDVTITNRASAGFGSDPTMPLDVDSEETVNEAIAPDSALRVLLSSNPVAGSDISCGDEIEYTIQVLNESTTPEKHGAVFMYIPEHTTFVKGSASDGLEFVETGLFGGKPAVVAHDLEIGAYGDMTFTFRVKAEDTLADELVSAHATVGSFEGTPKADLEVSSGEVLHNIVAPKPAISITHTSDPAAGTEVRAGDVITYTFTVTETNGVPANGVAVFDYIPANTKFVEGSADGLEAIKDASGNVIALYADGISLKANGSREFSFQVEVSSVSADTEITNRPTCGFAEAPQLPLEIAAEKIDHKVIAPKPALRITKSATPSNTAVDSGDTIDYSFTVLNESEAIARGVAVFDAVPANSTYVAGSATGGLKELTDDEGNVVALWLDNITLAGNRTRTFGFAVTVNDELADGDSIVNRATCGFATAPTAALEIDSNEVVNNLRTAKPAISIEHSSDPIDGTVVAPGQAITYRVKVSETNGVAASGVAVYDAIPAGATFVEGSATGGFTPVVENGKVVALTATGINLGAKGTHELSFQVVVDATDVDVEIKNQPSCGFASEVTGPLAQVAKAIDHEVYAVKPVISIDHTSDPVAGSMVEPGSTIAYTVTLTETNGAKASGVAVYDAIPAGTTYVDGSAQGGFEPVLGENGDVIALVAKGIDLDAKGTHQLSFNVTVDATDTDVEIKNQPSCGITDTVDGPLPQVAKAIDHNVISAKPAISIDHTSDPVMGSRVQSGDTIAYTVTLTETNGVNASGVAVFDAIPTGTTYVDGSATGGFEPRFDENGNVVALVATGIDINAKGIHTLTFEVTVDDTDVDTEIKNQPSCGFAAEVTGPLAQVAKAIDHNVVIEHVTVAPELQIVKTQEPGNGAWIAGGDILTYHITVTNVGTDTASFVGIYDEAPEHTKFVADSLESTKGEVYVGEDGLLTNIAGDMAPGDTVTMTFKVKVDLGFEGTIRNRAMWVSPAADPNNLPDDVQYVDIDGADSADLVTPSAGILGVFGATVPVPSGSYTGISNEVTAGGNTQPTPTTPEPTVDPEPSQPSQPEQPSQPSTPGQSNEVEAQVTKPQVSIVKSANVADGANVQAGAKVSYKLVVTNTGQVNANDLYVLDKLSAQLSLDKASVKAEGLNVVANGSTIVARGSLVPGAEATIEFDATVKSSAAGAIVNFAEWGQAEAGAKPESMLGKSNEYTINVTTSGQGAGTSGSNEVTAFVSKPQVRIIKTSDPADGSIVAPGTEITYTLAIDNIGRVNANDLYIKDALAAGCTFVEGSLSAEGVEATFADGAVIARGSLAPSAGATVTFKVKVNDDFTGDIVNVAEWGQAEPGEEPAEMISRSNETIAHVGTTDIELIKSADVADGSYIARGTKFTYTLTATNKGTLPVDIVIEDILPAGLRIIESSLPEGVSIVDGKLVFEAGMLEPGKDISISFEVEVVADAIGDIVNEASWHAKDSDDKVPSNSVTLHVGEPVISIAKTSDPVAGSIVAPGTEISYEVALKNEGTVAGIARVSDVLPEGLELDANSVTALIVDDAQSVAEDAANSDVAVDVKPTDPLGIAYRAFTDFVDWITGKPADDAGFIVEGNSIRGAMNIKPGEAVVVRYTATVKADLPYGTELANKATLEVEGKDPETAETKVIVGSPAVSISKTSDPVNGSTVAAGDTIQYTVEMNNGGNKAGHVVFNDKIPAGLTVDADSIEVVANEAQAADKAANAANAANAADVAAATDAAAAGEEEALLPAADAAEGEAKADEAKTEDVASGINVTTTEGGITGFFKSLFGSKEQGITFDGKEFKGEFDIAAGATVTIRYKATVNADVKAETELKNVASATVDGKTPISAEDKLTVGAAHITMSKTVDPATGTKVNVGDTLTYDMYLTNDGSATAKGAVIIDTIPEHTSYVAGSAKVIGQDGVDAKVAEGDIVTKDADGKVNGISYMVGDIAAKGKSAHVTFQVKVEEGATKVITNIGKFDVNVDKRPENPEDKPSDEGGTSPQTDNPIKSDPVGAKLTVKKTGVDANGKDVTTFTTGSEQLWKIVVANEGDTDATNVRLEDVFGEGMTFVSATIDGKNAAYDITGKSSDQRNAAQQAANAQRAAQTSAGTYKLGIASGSVPYCSGSAVEGKATNTYATLPIPAGTYTVTIDSGYRAAGVVSKLDDSGAEIAKQEYNLGYAGVSADSVTVEIPENCYMTVSIWSVSDTTLTPVTSTSVKPLTFTRNGNGSTTTQTTTTSTTSSSKYAADFTLDVPAGKSVTVLVKTKTSTNAASKITNTANVYANRTDAKPTAVSAATLDRTAYTEPAKKKDNLPATAAAIGGLGIMGAGIAFTLGGGLAAFKTRKKDDAE